MKTHSYLRQKCLLKDGENYIIRHADMPKFKIICKLDRKLKQKQEIM